MKYLSVLGENIPLCALTGFSYTKSANLVETRKLEVKSKGYSCLSVSVSLNITPFMLEYYRSANTFASAFTMADMVRHFMELNPALSTVPTNIILADRVICPQLQFSLVSATHQLQTDINGLLQECNVTWSLAGTKCTKQEASDEPVSYDTEIPEVTLSVAGKSLNIKNSCSITEFTLTPSTLHLQIALSDSFVKKKSNDWVKMPAIDYDSFIDVKGYGKYFIRSSNFDDNFVTYECSIFPKESEVQIAKTVMKGTLKNVFDELYLEIKSTPDVNKISVDYFKLNGTSQDILKQLQTDLGLMVGFDTDSRVRIFNLPEMPSSDLPTINYNIDSDIVSAPTSKIIYRNPAKEVSYGNNSGDVITINTTINSEDRSKALLKYYQFMERMIELDVPYDSRIRHCSYIGLVYQNKIIPAMVTDFNADVLNNSMHIVCNYWMR